MTPEELGRTLGRIEEKLDSQGEVVERLETKVDYTNGRVRALEMWKARALGVAAAAVFAAPIVLPVLLH